MTLFRIYFRLPAGKSRWSAKQDQRVVDGEAARDEILARRSPKAIFWEEAIVHTCSVCGKQGAWKDEFWDGGRVASWCWLGTDAQRDAGEPLVKYCGSACLGDVTRPPYQGDVDPEHRLQLSYFEPLNDRAREHRYRSIAAANDTTAHRKVPMPNWPGPGKCRWCLQPTVWENGKRIGQLAPTRNWHNDCYYQYRLHTELAAQFDFLFKRDGPRCAICADGGYRSARIVSAERMAILEPDGLVWPRQPITTYLLPSIKLDVDHVIPLWRAEQFTTIMAERRRLYGPDNLWLLCGCCHKKKTAIEAAERAALKRSPSAV